MEILRNTPGSDDSDSAQHSRQPSKQQGIMCDNSDYHTDNTSQKLQITKITPAVKNENRVNIFVNDEYSFSLDIAQLVDLKLKVGQIITAEQLAEYKEASEFGKLYQSALEWALSRPHSVQELRDYFKRKQFRRKAEEAKYQHSQKYLHSDEFRQLDKEHRQQIRRTQPRHPAPPISAQMIDQVIAKLVEKGYVNDQRFAEYYVEYRHAKKGVSLKKLRLELVKKGIDSATIEQTLQKIPRDDATEIRKIIAKKRQRYADNDKLIQYLLRQGFPYELAKTAVLETDSQNSE